MALEPQSNSGVDIYTSAYTVLSKTATGDVFIGFDLEVTSLHTNASVLTAKITVGSVSRTGTYTKPSGETSAYVSLSEVYVSDTDTVAITLVSSNSNDTSVNVAAIPRGRGLIEFNVWKVRKWGSSTMDGHTESTPFLTIASAVAVVSDGDLIDIGVGDFAEKVDLETGTLSNITLRGQGPGTIIAPAADDGCLPYTGTVLENLCINAAGAGAYVGVLIDGAYNDIQIRRCLIYGYYDGILVNAANVKRLRMERSRFFSGYDGANLAGGIGGHCDDWIAYYCQFVSDGSYTPSTSHFSGIIVGGGSGLAVNCLFECRRTDASPAAGHASGLRNASAVSGVDYTFNNCKFRGYQDSGSAQGNAYGALIGNEDRFHFNNCSLRAKQDGSGDEYDLAFTDSYSGDGVFESGLMLDRTRIYDPGSDLKTSAGTLTSGAIKATTFDGSTAYPVTQADTGSTSLARTGADGDTLEDISDEVGAAYAGLAAGQTTIEGKVDTIDSNVDAVLEDTGTTIPATITTVTNRIGAFTGSGVNTILGFFKALMSKTASTPSDVGGTFDPSADSAEALRDRGDASWVTITDAGIRTALGMASADLDTQIAALPTANENADAFLDRTSAIDGKTPRQALRYIGAGAAGLRENAGTGTETFYGLDGTTKRFTATVDSSGNTETIVYDPS